MKTIAIVPSYPAQAQDHECGPCYACCKWLGIEELKKYAGQTCSKLNGGADATKRCSIYSTRPSACSGYQCFWRAGFGPEGLRPHESGILITIYEDQSDGAIIPNVASATVTVFDERKANNKITPLLAELLPIPIMREVRLIYIETKRGILFRNGNVYACDVIPSKGYEALAFAAYDPPIGHYHTEEAQTLDALQEKGYLVG